METKILVIGVVLNGDKVLMRKKSEGSLPYKETWYLFGGELSTDGNFKKTIIDEIKGKTGVIVKLQNQLSWDTEVKQDLDGREKLFIYLDTLCEYVSGELKLSEGIEKLEWIPKNELTKYDIVPPARKLFEKLGYLS